MTTISLSNFKFMEEMATNQWEVAMMDTYLLQY